MTHQMHLILYSDLYSGNKENCPYIREMWVLGNVDFSLPSNKHLESKDESGKVHIRVNAQQMSMRHNYTGYGGQRHPICVIIKFDWTSCHFGGQRLWFLCPKCGRRVGILYSGKHYYCRICRNLAYPSENEPKPNRMLRKANKIRNRLKREPGVQNKIWFKPKGMHQKTFDRLLQQVQKLEYEGVKQLFNSVIRN
jgi:hypothetical protein